MKVNFSDLLLYKQNEVSSYILGLKWLMQKGLNISLIKSGNEYHLIEENDHTLNIAKSIQVQDKENKYNNNSSSLHIFQLSENNLEKALILLIDEFKENEEFFYKKLNKALYFENDNIIYTDIYPENSYDPLHIEDLIETIKSLAKDDFKKLFLTVAKDKDLDIKSLIILENLLFEKKTLHLSYTEDELNVFEVSYLKTLDKLKSLRIQEKAIEVELLSYFIYDSKFVKNSVKYELLNILKDNRVFHDNFTFLSQEKENGVLLRFKNLVETNSGHSIKFYLDVNNLKKILNPYPLTLLLDRINNSVGSIVLKKNPIHEVLINALNKYNVKNIEFTGDKKDINLNNLYSEQKYNFSIWIDLNTDEKLKQDNSIERKVNEELKIFCSLMNSLSYKEILNCFEDLDYLEKSISSYQMKNDNLTLSKKKSVVKKF